MAATIMILYNLFTWVELTQNMKKSKNLKEEPDGIKRAMMMISELDSICDSCTTIKNSILTGEVQEEEKVNVDEEEEQVPKEQPQTDLSGHILELWDLKKRVQYFSVLI